MVWFFRKPDTIAPDLVADDDSTIEETTILIVASGYHCAWCGEEPDENGSHGICPMHSDQQYAVVREHRRRR